MSKCEDWPACGHDVCPDYDESGRQLNMKCVCGASVPLTNHTSLCDGCLSRMAEQDPYGYYEYHTGDNW